MITNWKYLYHFFFHSFFFSALRSHPLFQEISWEKQLDTEMPFVPCPDDQSDTSYFDGKIEGEEFSGFNLISGILASAKYLKSGKNLTLNDEMNTFSGTFSGNFGYRRSFDIRHNKSQDFDVSHLVFQLSLPNPLKPGVKSRMKM